MTSGEAASVFLRTITQSYAKSCGMSQEHKALDAVAFSVMLLLAAVWGFQQVAIKAIAADVSLLMQAAIRSVIGTLLLLAWARARGVSLFDRDGTFWPGVLAGLLFAGEFFFIYEGLVHTNASRMSVIFYLAPALTALGLHFFVRGERLAAWQWLGVTFAFAGIVVAFADGFFADGATLRGDVYAVVAAMGWAATTVLIRATRLGQATAAKTLFYQLAISSAFLPLASFMMGEPGLVSLTPLVVASLAYQGVVVAFASYLAWFWLLTRYLASRLSVLSSMTPIFGVLCGVAFLSEPLSPTFALAALLVASGIVLVNLRR